MTEEEKKAIEALKKDLLTHECWEANNLDTIFKKGHLHFLRVVLNLIQKQDTEINKLKEENNTLKEQVQMFIPRRRVRRVYKMLGKILRTDIDPILLEKELKSEERRGEYE